MKRYMLLVLLVKASCLFSQERITHFLQMDAAEHVEWLTGVARSASYKINIPMLKEVSGEGDERNCNDSYRRLGNSVDVSYSLNDGCWTTIDKGRVWQLSAYSPGAASLNFVIDDFVLKEGSELCIVNADNSILFGPVSAVALGGRKRLLTIPMDGDNATLYLFEPTMNTGTSTLTVSRVVQGYESLFESMGSDFLKVACYPEFLDYSDAVARIIYPDGVASSSTGFMIMSADMAFNPYFLTAYHVLDYSPRDGVVSDSEIQGLSDFLFLFRDRCDDCNSNWISSRFSFQGAVLRAAWESSDFALLEITAPVNYYQDLFWLGWDRSGSVSASGTCIHHPYGLDQRIAFANSPFQTVDWSSNGVYNHWGVSFDEGAVGYGSSGSPLLNQSNRVVGQLHGSNPLEDKFGKFSASWMGGGTVDTRLSDWLDPLGVGLMAVDGYRAFYLNGSTIPCGNAAYVIHGLPVGHSVSWLVEGTGFNGLSTEGNTLYIPNTDNHYINGTLYANIVHAGDTITTLSKKIDTGANFTGICYLENDTSQTAIGQIYSGQTIHVHKCDKVVIQSDDFVGATITYQRKGLFVTVKDWQNMDDVISFRLDITPLVFGDSICGDEILTDNGITLTVKKNGGCMNVRLTFLIMEDGGGTAPFPSLPNLMSIL